MPKQSGMADLIVKGAIALITAAFFVAAYLQLQMSFVGALAAALSLYAVLMLGHAVMRRSEREKDLVYEMNRLEDEVTRLRTTGQPVGAAGLPGMPRVSRPSGIGAPPPPVPPAPRMGAPAGPAAVPAKPAAAPRAVPDLMAPDREPRLSSPRAGAEPPAAPAEPGLAVPPPAAPPAMAAAPEIGVPVPNLTLRAERPQAELPPMPSLPDWSAPPAAPAAAGGKTMHDYWPSAGKPTLPEPPRAELPPAPTEREADLDAVQGMIKRLAEEVDTVDEPTLEGLPQRQESMLRASLNALQTTASAMRSSKSKSPLPAGGAGPRTGVMPPPIMPSHTRLASLAEAVSAGRVEVALSPIVGLADDQLHYHEVVASPRDEHGNLLSITARDPQLAVGGLLPMLDSARLRQAARVAATLADEGRDSCLFAPATAVSLANDGFLDELADAYREREALSGELVLAFAQADVRTFGGSEWSALTDMRDLGFRFCVEDVTDFDYEFTALCAAGFAFVKVDAAALLAGLAAPNGRMSAEEVCRNLGELGLTLIVANVGDEATRDKVLAAGVPLGQGALFGDPATAGEGTFAAADDAAA